MYLLHFSKSMITCRVQQEDELTPLPPKYENNYRIILQNINTFPNYKSLEFGQLIHNTQVNQIDILQLTEINLTQNTNIMWNKIRNQLQQYTSTQNRILNIPTVQHSGIAIGGTGTIITGDITGRIKGKEQYELKCWHTVFYIGKINNL